MSTLAEQMKADALEAQRFSRKHLVLELDYSATSIDELEENADSVEYALRGGKTEENVTMLTRIWGAYIGESMRRLGDGEWTTDDGGRVALRIGGNLVYPHDAVRRRIAEDEGHLGTFFRSVISP